MAIKIHQIYYNLQQEKFLEKSFIPYFNQKNPRPEWREYFVFRTEYLAEHCARGDITGYVSWKFTQKTQINGESFIRFIEENPGYDVYFINPFPMMAEIFQNVWLNGEHHHPDMLSLAQKLFDQLNIGIVLAEMEHDAQNTLYCNFWAGTRQFWDAYMAFCEPFYALIEHVLNDETKTLFAKYARQPLHYRSYAPYFMERLFSTFLLLNPSIKALPYSYSEEILKKKLGTYYEDYQALSAVRAWLQKTPDPVVATVVKCYRERLHNHAPFSYWLALLHKIRKTLRHHFPWLVRLKHRMRW